MAGVRYTPKAADYHVAAELRTANLKHGNFSMNVNNGARLKRRRLSLSRKHPETLSNFYWTLLSILGALQVLSQILSSHPCEFSEWPKHLFLGIHVPETTSPWPFPQAVSQRLILLGG